MKPGSKDEFFDLPVQHSHAKEDVFIGRMYFCVVDARMPTECPNFELTPKPARPRPACPEHPNERMSWGDVYTRPDGKSYRYHL